MEHHGTLQKSLFNATICQLIVYFTIGCSLFFSGNQAPPSRPQMDIFRCWARRSPCQHSKCLRQRSSLGLRFWKGERMAGMTGTTYFESQAGALWCTFHKTGTWYILRRCNKILPERGMYIWILRNLGREMSCTWARKQWSPAPSFELCRTWAFDRPYEISRMSPYVMTLAGLTPILECHLYPYPCRMLHDSMKISHESIAVISWAENFDLPQSNSHHL